VKKKPLWQCFVACGWLKQTCADIAWQSVATLSAAMHLTSCEF